MLAGVSAGNYQAAADQLVSVGLGEIIGLEEQSSWQQPSVAAKKAHFEGGSLSAMSFTPEF